MLPSELYQKMYSLFPNFFISNDVKSEYQELYKLALSGIPSNHIAAAYKGVMTTWTYINPPKPGDFIKEINKLFPPKQHFSEPIFDNQPPPPTQAEIDDRKRVAMLFSIWNKSGFFKKATSYEAKEFCDKFNKTPVPECELITQNIIATGGTSSFVKKPKYLEDDKIERVNFADSSFEDDFEQIEVTL